MTQQLPEPSQVIAKAIELYQKHGFKQASFIAFDQMQQCEDEASADFWLHVINQVAVIDMNGLSHLQEIMKKTL